MSLPTIYIIGAGLSGATLARLLANHGHNVVVYEQANHIGGNCYDYFNKHGILVQKYGPHIFHTDKKHVYEFVKRFTKFNDKHINVLVNINDKLTDMPINFRSIDLFFAQNADIIKKYIFKQWPKAKSIYINDLLNCNHPQTKAWANFIFTNVYQNYSSKMWAIPIDKLDLNVLKRVGIIPSYEHNYFPNDQYQGMPINGFSKMIEQMLKHPKINLIKHKPQITFKNNETYINKQLVNTPIFYCGEVDKLLNYQYGKIPYRSLYFKFQTKQIDSFQPADVINYPNHPTITRVAEYKKINNQKIKDITTISYEYPGAYNINSTKFNKPYYPIHNPKNLLKYQKYVEHLQKYPNFYLLGRLAEYKYFDMDDAIDNAMSKFDNIKNKLKKH